MTTLNGDAIVETMHDAAIEVAELDGMTERVLQADDWMKERPELGDRLEAAIEKLNAVLEAIR